MRIPSRIPVLSGGWIHELEDKVSVPRPTTTNGSSIRNPNCAVIQSAFQRVASPEVIAGASRVLGVSVESLKRLHIGWCVAKKADTFPMKRSDGKVVGIRYRVRDGGDRKYRALLGSKEGLFIPAGFKPREAWAIVEGPTDCAAMLDMGIETIGRPSNLGGLEIMLDLVAKYLPPFILYVGDNDEPDESGRSPGEKGANQFMEAMYERFNGIRATAIYPPKGIKDARQWKLSGATKDDIKESIRMAQRRPRGW